jgi:protein tyrosine phosphatase
MASIIAAPLALTSPIAAATAASLTSAMREQSRLMGEFRALASIDGMRDRREFSASTSSRLTKLNRYSNVHANDCSLFPRCGAAAPELYINGNMLDTAAAFGTPHSFVAHQAPLPEGFAAYWLSVLAARAPVIVMLTPLQEGGSTKAHAYWPEYGSPPRAFQVPPTAAVAAAFGVPTLPTGGSDPLQLFITHRAAPCALPGFDPRAATLASFSVVLRAPASAGGAVIAEHNTLLIRYEAWPDFGVASSVQELLALVDSIATYAPVGAGPVFVHCSAGIGRTGTFVASYVLRHLVRRGVIPPVTPATEVVSASATVAEAVERCGRVPVDIVPRVVAWLKYQRTGSVQRSEQYALIYAAAVESCRSLSSPGL